jgi:nucleoid-associated protein YgaU
MIFGKNTKQYLLGGGIVLSALIILLLVVKYVPLDPTKIVVETVEEKIHFEVKPNLEIENIKPKDDMDSNKDVNLILEPTFDIIKLGEDNTLVIGGRAGINQKVKIFNGDQLIGEVITNQFGEFVFIEELAPGYYDLNLLSNGIKSQKTVSIIAPDSTKILAKEGTKLLPSESEAILATNEAEAIVPTREAEAIVPTREAEAIVPTKEAEAIVTTNESEAIVTINNSDGTIEKVIQGASNSNEANNLSFDSLSYTSEGTLHLSGKALPGAKVDVYIGKDLVGTAFADENGFWNITLDKPVKPGDYILRFNEIQDEKVIATLDTPIRQSDLSEISISENAIVVQPGNSLWRISRRFYGRGVLYTLIFKANNSQISDPDLIYPGQIFDIPRSKEN